MVFVISVTGANRLSLDLLAIIVIPTQLCQDLLAIIVFRNQVSLDLTAIIAFCIPKHKDFACLNGYGAAFGFPAFLAMRSRLSLDLIAIIAVRLYLFLNLSGPVCYNC